MEIGVYWSRRPRLLFARAAGKYQFNCIQGQVVQEGMHVIKENLTVRVVYHTPTLT